MRLKLRVAAVLAIVLSFSVPLHADMYFPGHVPPPGGFDISGFKWEPGPDTASTFDPATCPGTPGSATWSVMAPGLADGSFGFDPHPGVTIDFTTLTGSDELAMIATALATWDVPSGYSSLGMVADSGGGFGDPGAAGKFGDIRIGAIGFDGPFGVLAHNFFPFTEAIFPAGGNYGGDSHYDSAEMWVDDPLEDGIGPEIDLPTVLLHEFGHALGLGHSAVPGSVMFPFYGGANRSLSPDDLAGIVCIYGPGDVGVIPEPASLTLLGMGALGLLGYRFRSRKQAA